MSRAGDRPTKGAARPPSWVAAAVAFPLALLAWVALAIGLTLALSDFVLGAAIALAVLGVIGFLLPLAGGPRSRGAGIGTLLTLIPCALTLVLSLV